MDLFMQCCKMMYWSNDDDIYDSTGNSFVICYGEISDGIVMVILQYIVQCI